MWGEIADSGAGEKRHVLRLPVCILSLKHSKHQLGYVVTKYDDLYETVLLSNNTRLIKHSVTVYDKKKSLMERLFSRINDKIVKGSDITNVFRNKVIKFMPDGFINVLACKFAYKCDMCL